jgi:hypothetical protein
MGDFRWIVKIQQKIVFNTFFRWNVYSTPFAGSFYPYKELVTIYGVPHGKFCLRSSALTISLTSE